MINLIIGFALGEAFTIILLYAGYSWYLDKSEDE
jgi:hypothetical protein